MPPSTNWPSASDAPQCEHRPFLPRPAQPLARTPGGTSVRPRSEELLGQRPYCASGGLGDATWGRRTPRRRTTHEGELPVSTRSVQSLRLLAASALLAATTVLSPGASAQSAPTVVAGTDASGAQILTDASGRTLYLYTKDSANTTVCTGGCLAAWPALMASDTPTLANGVSGVLGTITRPEGGQQVTYNGWPVYYFAADAAPGDVKGQGVGKVWYTINPTSATASPITTKDDPQLGTMLSDASGLSLYQYARDTQNTSNCSGGCATAWPPLTTTGAPMLASGMPGALGIITREDGAEQVAYNGIPLYYYAQDEDAEDTYGQGVGNVWFVIAPADAPSAAAVSQPVGY